jgi:hypothetical protein
MCFSKTYFRILAALLFLFGLGSNESWPACPNDKCELAPTVVVGHGSPIKGAVWHPQAPDCNVTVPADELDLHTARLVQPCCDPFNQDLNGNGFFDPGDIALHLQMEVRGIKYDANGQPIGCEGGPTDEDVISWTIWSTKEVGDNPCVQVLVPFSEITHDPVDVFWFLSDFDRTTPNGSEDYYFIKAALTNPPNSDQIGWRVISDSRTFWCTNPSGSPAICSAECWVWAGYDTRTDHMVEVLGKIKVLPSTVTCSPPISQFNPASEEVEEFNIAKDWAPWLGGEEGAEILIKSVTGHVTNVTGKKRWKKIIDTSCGECNGQVSASATKSFTIMATADAGFSFIVELVRTLRSISARTARSRTHAPIQVPVAIHVSTYISGPMSLR